MQIERDIKRWYAISCPTTGVRFDLRMLELMDADHDGHVRTPEVLAALDYLKDKGVDESALDNTDPEDEKRLADVLARIAEADKAEPSESDRAALAAWEEKGRDPSVAFLGDATAAANDALAAVEKIVDAYFTPPEDMPLVTDEPDRMLSLRDRLNPKYQEAIMAFAEKCVTPLLGERTEIGRLEWKSVRDRFAPYRAWAASKPVANAELKSRLEDEERLLRYRLRMGEFLANYMTMDRLYSGTDYAIFQTGILRIDGREMNLCFHVESEAAHSALAGKSNCCVIYLKLTRPAEKAERNICAVVTAGKVATLYVGRNGVFYDRDGRDWEAVITKVVESQVSLKEAFWTPWRKLGEGVAGAVKKFLGAKQTPAANIAAPAAKEDVAKAGGAAGAAMASSVAAIGIGISMVGVAFASIMAAVSSMSAGKLALSLVAVVLVVSLPSVILTWFKLRRRDIGAILNASGWAVNREMRFSMKRARGFTKCPPCRCKAVAFVVAVLVAAAIVAAVACCRRGCCQKRCGSEKTVCTQTQEVNNAQK